MADSSSSFVSNKWRHYDISSIVRDSLCFANFLDFIRDLTI